MRGAVVVVVVALSLAGEARAEEGAEPAAFSDYWSTAGARWFGSALVAVGAVTAATATAGYGKPHWTFVGLEARGLSTFEFGAVSAGLTAQFLVLNASVAARRSWSYRRRLAAAARAFDEDDLADAARPRAAATSIDVTLSGYVPAGPTLGAWEVTQVFLPGKPADVALFEEWVRFPVNRRYVAMGRFAWTYGFARGRVHVGPAADVVVSPGREALVRVGLACAIDLTTHLSFSVYGSLPVTSPDALDTFTQSWGIARLSFKWATGEARPGLW